MTLNEILALLQNVKRSGDKFTALCPAHKDDKHSLSIGEKGGKF